MNFVIYCWRVLRDATKGFFNDFCFRYSASLSFYALFSMAPVVMISIHVAGLLARDFDFQQQVTQRFTLLVGERGAEGISVLINSLQDEASTRFQLIISSAILLFSATNIFIQLQSAFNEIFSVQAKVGRGILKQLLDRLISLGLLFSLGFIMIISLIIDSIIVSLQSYLNSIFPDSTVILVGIIQFIILTSLIMFIIYSLVSFLPDVVIPKRFKLQGTVVITVMLALGKFGIGWYISRSRFNELGGASASIVILMLWVYYSSLILFFGAELIKAMSKLNDAPLPPRRYAARVKTVLVEK